MMMARTSYAHSRSRNHHRASGDSDTERDDTELDIKVINNRIYFYEEITNKSILHLCSCIRNIEMKNLQLQNEYTLSEPPNIYIHLQSGGGDVFAGMSGMNAIENAKVPVVCIVDGFVASAATFLLLGATGGRQMRKNSNILIHQIRTEFWGRYDELRDEMRNSKNIMKTIKRIYKKKSDMPEEMISEIIKKEIYLTHSECLEYGLVTEII